MYNWNIVLGNILKKISSLYLAFLWFDISFSKQNLISLWATQTCNHVAILFLYISVDSKPKLKSLCRHDFTPTLLLKNKILQNMVRTLSKLKFREIIHVRGCLMLCVPYLHQKFLYLICKLLISVHAIVHSLFFCE